MRRNKEAHGNTFLGYDSCTDHIGDLVLRTKRAKHYGVKCMESAASFPMIQNQIYIYVFIGRSGKHDQVLMFVEK